MFAFYGHSSAPDFQDNCSNLRLLFCIITSHFVLYTLTDKFSYNNKIYIAFQKVKGHISQRINKVTQRRTEILDIARLRSAPSLLQSIFYLL